MGRRYDTARFYESVRLLREHFDNCGISADLITGFPGETEEEFNKTLEFIKECDFMHVHVFPYSERKGTKAADMPDKVSKSVRLERAARALETAGEMEKRFIKIRSAGLRRYFLRARSAIRLIIARFCLSPARKREAL